MPVVDVVMFSEQKEGSESFVGTWLKQTGEAVSEFEPIVEISTDKVSMEIAASASGTLKEILKAEEIRWRREKFWRASRPGSLRRLLPLPRPQPRNQRSLRPYRRM